ncbi:MAG: EAL domain-containing protein, partial [Hydrogenophaga sp.]|nr:EAL domain-containing protein [Hydrogenophaga sp.]
SDANDLAIATAVVAMAHSLGLEVLAEGVETAMQLDMLRTLGCETVQGYLLGRPVPAEQLNPSAILMG